MATHSHRRLRASKALEHFMETYNLNINDIKIMCEDMENHETSVMENDQTILKEFENINILTLSDSPSINAKIGDQNIIYVNEYSINKNLCSTTKIKFMERELWLNMCDCDDVTTVNLDIAINDKVLYNIPFIVKESMNNHISLEIRKDILNEK